MTASLHLSWREQVSAEGGADGVFRVSSPRGCVEFRRLTSAVRKSLEQITSSDNAEELLAETVLDSGGAGALAEWYFTLQGLARRGLLCRVVQSGGRSLAILVPTSPAFLFAPAAIVGDGPFLLSRFAYLRREGDRLLVESPLAHARIVIEDERLGVLIAALVKARLLPELVERSGGLAKDAILLLLGLLDSARMLQAVGPAGIEQEPDALRSWEFHDLLFHARSRKGRSDAPFGATYRMAGQIEPPPAIKTTQAVEIIALHRPDVEALRREDPPLAEIMEQRRSRRTYDTQPISARQLGEFLYRVGRIKDSRAVEMATPGGSLRMEFVARPYPSGGALYELEFYVLVHACDGLAAGLYHYDALHHRVGRLAAKTSDVEHLLADAAASADIPVERVQVVILLSARFPRLAWKYASIAYALILKHVGVVYQTMYLAATAMDLAPCALGGGDADLFAQAAGTDYYAETSVGEFLLGRRDPCETNAAPR